jgi:LmbE family N-acetylglucosaminyl deacetylase
VLLLLAWLVYTAAMTILSVPPSAEGRDPARAAELRAAARVTGAPAPQMTLPQARVRELVER